MSWLLRDLYRSLFGFILSDTLVECGMKVSFPFTNISIMFTGSCSLVLSLSDGMNESFILTRIFQSAFFVVSMLLLSYFVLLLFPLAAHVPVGFILSPGDLLAGLAEVRVGWDGE